MPPRLFHSREIRFLIPVVAAYSLFFLLAQEAAWLLWRRSLTAEVPRFLVWSRDLPAALGVAVGNPCGQFES